MRVDGSALLFSSGKLPMGLFDFFRQPPTRENFAAQLIKFLLVILQQRRLNFPSLVTTGGMPSSHSAFTVCLTTSVGLNHGFNSTYFAMCFVFTMIVMYGKVIADQTPITSSRNSGATMPCDTENV